MRINMVCRNCGGKRFYAEQTFAAYEKVVVDCHGEYVDSVADTRSIIDAERPVPTEDGFVCISCGEAFVDE